LIDLSCPGGWKIAPVSPYFLSSWTDNNTDHDQWHQNVTSTDLVQIGDLTDLNSFTALPKWATFT